MKKDINAIDKNGFSNKFFEELEKEHDKISEFANRQKQLKQKHSQSGLK
jgi:hypothetical protein